MERIELQGQAPVELLSDAVELDLSVEEYVTPGFVASVDGGDVTRGNVGLYTDSGLNSKHS